MKEPEKFDEILKEELHHYRIEINKFKKFKIHLYNEFNCSDIYFTSLKQTKDWISEIINNTGYENIWPDFSEFEIKTCRNMIIKELYLKILKEWEETDDLQEREGEKETNNKDYNLKQTAYHEAGHAIVSYRLIHVPRGDISIKPGTDNSGNNYSGIFKGGVNLNSKDDLSSKEREIITRYAGHEAELLFNPKADLMNSKNDFKEAEKLYKEEGNYGLGELKKIAYKIVQENKAEIQTLAEELFDRQFLTRTEWELIISKSDIAKSEKCSGDNEEGI